MDATTLTKTVSYRVVSMSVTMAMAYWATGSLSVAASFGVTNLVVNSAVYFGFEKFWETMMSPAMSPALATT